MWKLGGKVAICSPCIWEEEAVRVPQGKQTIILAKSVSSRWRSFLSRQRESEEDTRYQHLALIVVHTHVHMHYIYVYPHAHKHASTHAQTSLHTHTPLTPQICDQEKQSHELGNKSRPERVSSLQTWRELIKLRDSAKNQEVYEKQQQKIKLNQSLRIRVAFWPLGFCISTVK